MLYWLFISFIWPDVDAAKNDKSSNSEEVESLKKLLQTEKTLKTQAVNKLAEIVQRKELGKNASNRGKVSSSEVKKKEKENKKLNMELRQVCMRVFTIYYLKHRDILTWG